MDRTNAPHHIHIASGKRGFRDQNIAIGQIGTRVEAAFLNSVQEEIMTVIEKAGLTPNASDWSQIWQALHLVSQPSFYGRHYWHEVQSMSLTAPPAATSSGYAYLIAANATGQWAGKSGQIAIRDTNGWIYIAPRDGHGFALPDGSVYVRAGGSYKLLRLLYQNWFDGLYAQFSEPPSHTFYVNGTSGNDSNLGNVATQPFKTIQGAVSAISSKYITQSSVKIIVSPGTYEGFSIWPSLVQRWQFTGNRNNPATTIIKSEDLDVNGGRGFVIYDNEAVVEGFKFQSMGENIVTTGGSLSLRDCHFNMPTANFVAVYFNGGRITLHGSFHVGGAGGSVFGVNASGRMKLGSLGGNINQPCHVVYNNVTARASCVYTGSYPQDLK